MMMAMRVPDTPWVVAATCLPFPISLQSSTQKLITFFFWRQKDVTSSFLFSFPHTRHKNNLPAPPRARACACACACAPLSLATRVMWRGVVWCG